MSTNPLKNGKLAEGFVPKLTAADFASIARENGDWEKAKAWQRVADERGEDRIPDHKRVSFNTSKEKIYVPARWTTREP